MEKSKQSISCIVRGGPGKNEASEQGQGKGGPLGMNEYAKSLAYLHPQCIGVQIYIDG